ncbi:hypothetical protein N7533_010407 [Penicillium manginii]|uniref:uncharacterized protein n=1 Tax=Penicillium manginii TaxID=203109 RepID=UPI002547EED6|nr:uncharacterized protein N7533_010407 [Penicillium manginii]KAJ5743305.1 hypothetical protein N7533_010407 [Penicillium manginii]
MLCDSQTSFYTAEVPAEEEDDELARYLAKAPLPALDPISDNEEEEGEKEEEEEEEEDRQEPSGETQKRARSGSTSSQEDQMEHEGTQRATRIRKKPKMPEGFQLAPL